MKRRLLIGIITTAALLVLAALAGQQRGTLLILDWAAKGEQPVPPVALLIEMGVKDGSPTSWPGRATVTGARIVHREGYRFRTGDKLVDPDAWEASSRRGLRVPKGQPAVAKMEAIATVGVVLHLADVQPDAALTVQHHEQKAVVPLGEVLAGRPKAIWDEKAQVRRISLATPVVTAKTEDDFPVAAYGPDGTIWLAYISYTVKEESRRIEAAPLAEQPRDFNAFYTPEFGDQLFVKAYRNGKWSDPVALTGPREDLVRCAVAVAGTGEVLVAYSAHRQGKHQIYLRAFDGATARPGPEFVLTNESKPLPSPCLAPVMATGRDGAVWIACQSRSKSGLPAVYLGRIARQGDGWLTKMRESLAEENGSSWTPSVAALPDSEREFVAVAHDIYQDGDYDIRLTRLRDRQLAGSSDPMTYSSRFEARPSVACDPSGRIWIAYEEGSTKWGKDYGAQDSADGNPLYGERSVRVICWQGGQRMKPVAELPTSRLETPKLPFDAPKTQQFERATRYAYPQIGLDGKGRVWLTYRQKFGTRYSSHPGSYWLTFARRLDGDRWSEPIELHHSDGLLDHRPVVLPAKHGGVYILHNTDGRYTTPETIDNQIYLSYVDLPGEPVEPKLVPFDMGDKDPALLKRHEAEQAAVKQIRSTRIAAGGEKLQPLRGEFHRHTEISWDGGPDGSLEDMFRYAIDAASFDWIGNGDHDNGAGREYSWWLTQKFTDAYHVPNQFTGMFTYERSVAYPHGHRNCMFARRGIRTLPRLNEPDPDKRVGQFHADDTKMLYRYLHELNGICAVHTSATSMGTDWRDNDPVVEPLVEIYQGDRMSYEHEGAPRAGYEAKSGKEPVNVAGWFPKGFINHAFAKGYRLGFQASSDHWSTHISYCIVLAERNDREAILDAVKKRHCYGATDDIVVDLHSGEHIMGDAFKTSTAPRLNMHVIGTKRLAQIDVLKDSQVVATLHPKSVEYRGDWTDPKPNAGTHYYYIRVRQEDDELAWASPMWIDYERP